MSNLHTDDLLQVNHMMRSQPCPQCYLCGETGQVLYRDVKDRIAQCPGTWDLRRCPTCELLWIDPLPLPKDIGLAYEGYFTHDTIAFTGDIPLRRRSDRVKRAYLCRKFGYPNPPKSLADQILGCLLMLAPSRSQYVDASVLHLHHRPGRPRMLDVGCGSGVAISLLQSLGWDVEGLDFDPVVVQHARDVGLRVHLGSLGEQRYPDATFDAVTMSHVIEHVHDPIAVIRECVRVLKPGGTLVILTPNAASWGHRMFKASWLYLDPPRHLYIFTPLALRKTAELGGLTNVTMRTRGGTAPNMYMGSQAIARTGRFDIGEVTSSRRGLRAESIDVIAWLLRCIAPLRGEEIVVLGTKSQ